MHDPNDTLSPALRALVDRFSQMLRAVGTRYGLTPADVDEMVQEVRLSIWRSRPKSEWIAAISASYMYRTAVTAALTVIRRRRSRTHGANLSLDSAAEIADLTAGANRVLARSELSQAVAKALATLSDSRATVVRLHLSGYTREEIATLYSWSESRTRNLLYRGLDDLRHALLELGIRPGESA